MRVRPETRPFFTSNPYGSQSVFYNINRFSFLAIATRALFNKANRCNASITSSSVASSFSKRVRCSLINSSMIFDL